jgi:hypothetical protein
VSPGLLKPPKLRKLLFERLPLFLAVSVVEGINLDSLLAFRHGSPVLINLLEV